MQHLGRGRKTAHLDIEEGQQVRSQGSKSGVSGSLRLNVAWLARASSIHSTYLPRGAINWNERRRSSGVSAGGAPLAPVDRYHGWPLSPYHTMITPARCFRETVERDWLPAWYD